MKKSIVIIFIFIFIFFLEIYGQTWSTLRRLTWNTGSSSWPIIATDSNNYLHVVWCDNTLGNSEIFYKKSTDGGVNWLTKRLTWNSGDSNRPTIALDVNNYLHVVWRDDTPGNWEIFYKKSTDGGVNWSTKRLTWNSGDSGFPAVVIDSNNHPHVVWCDDTPGNSEIFYKKSTDGGVNWSTKRLTWNSGISTRPTITSDSNNHLHLVWCDDTPKNGEIFYKQSTDGGANWLQKRLTWNSGDSGAPIIVTDTNNHLHLVCCEEIPPNWEIFYKQSTDGGVNWSTKRLTWNSGDSFFPSVATDSNNYLHVVWWDDTPGNFEIFYKQSTDGGVNWSTKRLTWNSGVSGFPAIATESNNYLHVVWCDDTPGDFEIYYKNRK